MDHFLASTSHSRSILHSSCNPLVLTLLHCLRSLCKHSQFTIKCILWVFTVLPPSSSSSVLPPPQGLYLTLLCLRLSDPMFFCLRFFVFSWGSSVFITSLRQHSPTPFLMNALPSGNDSSFDAFTILVDHLCCSYFTICSFLYSWMSIIPDTWLSAFLF